MSGGNRTWTVTTDGTWEVEGVPHIADGLVYVVQRRLDKPAGEFTLAVYDAATGTERSRTEIPIPPGVKVRADPDHRVGVSIQGLLQ